jgi:hypothetical protein
MFGRKVLDHLLAIATGQTQASSKHDEPAVKPTEPDSGAAGDSEKS